jgi:hypothetical protein
LLKAGKRPAPDSETYVGEVVRAEDGGCVRAKTRVRGIGS